MSKRIAAVPATINRQAYVDMWASLGIDATHIKSAECGPNDVVVTVYALNEAGDHYLQFADDDDPDDAGEIATHVVSLQVLP